AGGPGAAQRGAEDGVPGGDGHVAVAAGQGLVGGRELELLVSQEHGLLLCEGWDTRSDIGETPRTTRKGTPAVLNACLQRRGYLPSVFDRLVVGRVPGAGPEEPSQAVTLGPGYDVGVQVRDALRH